ncbi:MAG: hypothetical protein Tp1100SUR639781_47 [Prokaryotic dsDNA virus sp.]|jgi:hypothetical protein|nr:MAG: hypothetical protein Tp1100SUR639781_47 [Prokaryotic dsDNA virus sp.]|tara:strand:+ start:10263 stop:10469 length:207 start_codon:yes stop_codon:yes gene_type:complete
MAKQFTMIKVAVEIHEDDWNGDLRINVMRGNQLLEQYTATDLEIIEVSANLITDVKENNDDVNNGEKL